MIIRLVWFRGCEGDRHGLIKWCLSPSVLWMRLVVEKWLGLFTLLPVAAR